MMKLRNEAYNHYRASGLDHHREYYKELKRCVNSAIYREKFGVEAGGGRCSAPRLPNGRARLRQSGQLLKFSCQVGFHLVGNRYASCRGGRWDVDLPSCVKSGCKAVDVPNAVQVPLHDGAWIYFFCTPGHRHDGPAVIYCNGKTWNGTAPNCIVSSAPGQMSCDFEAGLCGWTQDELHDFDWKRWSGRTPSAFMFTGPRRDHTHADSTSGYYMYLEATSRLENDTARLLSPVYYSGLAKSGCFSFFYHMFGRGIGGLRVFQKPQSVDLQTMLSLPEGEKNKYLVFNRWGDQGDFWYGSVSSLNEIGENFQMVIEGVRGSSFTSDIAVDDVALLQGEKCAEARANIPTPPVTVLASCSGRCGEEAAAAGAGLCGCSATCVFEENCCPDYYDLCGFTDTTTDNPNPIKSDTDEVMLPDKQPLVATTAEILNITTPSAHLITPKLITTQTSTISTKLITFTPKSTAAMKPSTTITTTRVPVTALTSISTKVPFTKSTKENSAFTSMSITAKTTATTPAPKRNAKVSTRTAVKLPTASIPVEVTKALMYNASRVLQATTKPTTRLPSFMRPTTTQQVLVTKKLNTDKQTEKTKKSEEAQAGVAALLSMVALALACCVGAATCALRSRAARAHLSLALVRMRARSQRHPDVRFLTADDHE